MPATPIMFFHRQCGELGSQKASPYAKPLRRDTAAIFTSLRKWPLAPLERRGGPPAGLPRSHGVKSYASHGAPTSSPSLPCLCESAFGGNQIRHTVACRPFAFVRRGGMATFNYLRNKQFELIIKFILAKTCIFTGKRLRSCLRSGCWA